MTPENFRRVRELFDVAADLPDAERQAYLEHKCSDAPELRARIDGSERHDEIGSALATFLRRRFRKETVAEAIGAVRQSGNRELAVRIERILAGQGNVIERAIVLGDGQVVRREDLPDEVAAWVGDGQDEPGSDDSEPSDSTPGDFQSALVAFKKRLILDAWRLSDADYGRTAERLGVHVNSLHRMIRNLGLKDRLQTVAADV